MIQTNMNKENSIKLFEDRKIRTVWNEEEEEWYFSVVDVVGVLSDQPAARSASTYWAVLKKRLVAEGAGELLTNCKQLKLPAADGKNYLTDVADTKQVFRLIQSIPSKKAEPFKLWLAEVAKQRIDQLQDPELSIKQAMTDYKRLGYSDNWINQRLKSIEIRKDLTDEWKRHGLQEGVQFASLTDIIYKTWSGKTAKEYKKFKGLKKENLRDNMTNKELVINMLAELSTKEISEVSNPETMSQHAEIARRGSNIAKEARLKLESETGKKVVSPLNAKSVLSINTENKNDETV
jgi:4-diphosphocytidyl-2C-methyl-D-erythritol kinase